MPQLTVKLPLDFCFLWGVGVMAGHKSIYNGDINLIGIAAVTEFTLGGGIVNEYDQ